MAAPLKTIIKVTSTVSRLPCTRSWVRYSSYSWTYFEKNDDSLYEIGERKRDKYVNIPQKYVRKHPESFRKGQYELESPKGKPFDKKPFPVNLVAGKRYKWCSCGHSRTQPLCDGTHKVLNSYGGESMTAVYPKIFEVEKDGQYWLCNCKQTNNRPFCDASHRSEDLQRRKM